MSNFFRTREGALTAIDTRTQLTTVGSQTAPGALLVPGSATHIRALHVAAVASNEAADQYGFLIRLEGPGIKRGTYVTPAGAGGGSVATGGHTLVPGTRLPVNLAVEPGQEILIVAEAVGDDMGTYQVAVTIEFGTEAGPEGEILGEITVEGDITAVDTKTQLTSQGSTAAPSRLTPPGATKLKRIVYAVGSDAAADGEVTYLLRLGGDAVKGGEQVIVVGAESYIDVQAGSDSQHSHMSPVVLDNLDLDIEANETLDISIEMAGVDVGSATAVVQAQFM